MVLFKRFDKKSNNASKKVITALGLPYNPFSFFSFNFGIKSSLYWKKQSKNESFFIN